MGGHVTSPDDLAAARGAAGVRLRRGDVLLLRTGWVTAFRAAVDAEACDRLFPDRDYSGRSGGPHYGGVPVGLRRRRGRSGLGRR